MSQNFTRAQQNGHNAFYHNNNNNDSSFLSINYARKDEPVGDINPLSNTLADTSFSSSVNSDNKTVDTTNNVTSNTTMDLVMASPVSTASLKDLKSSYHMKKKYYTRNIQSAIDSAQEVHSGWLKARTTFKRWTKTWCQVKPGYLILYTSQEALKKHRLGVVLLSVCQVIRRPSKKDGFCFKLINPFGCSVWAKSSAKAIIFAQASLTLRVSDELIGRLWLDSFHRCHLSSNLEGYQPILNDYLSNNGSRANSRLGGETGDSSGDEDDGEHHAKQLEMILNHSNSTSEATSLSDRSSDINLARRAANKQLANGGRLVQTSAHITNQHEQTNSPLQQSKNAVPASEPRPGSSSDNAPNLNCTKMVTKFSKYSWREFKLESVSYLEDGAEELGVAGVQSEEVHDSNKNFLWHIIKQLRPGMDLSKVTLPTFILEPRSFLEKLADYYYHSDILSEAVIIDDPVQRLINIVKWYLSGFYKKPKGPKKPYNPILGERFRCFWDHPKTKSRTFFMAEQVSHHPPISAFHVTNRKDGYTITCALLSKSKYGGNSVSAILDGKAKLYLNKLDETYTITMPYANCRGILLGSLCMELGGKVEIECAETNCKCELDFKLASMWANQSSYNTLTGKILKDNKLTHTFDGHWDKKISMVEKSSDKKSTLWEVTELIKSSRLKRYTVNLRDQDERESVKLWSKVTEALIAGNQVVATAEKTRLEDMQRKEARERLGPFSPKHFQQQSTSGAIEWIYRWQDDRRWNDRRDIIQFEEDFKVRTLMLSPEGQTSSTGVDRGLDLQLSQLGKFSSQLQDLVVSSGREQASTSDSGSGGTFQGGKFNEEAMRTIVDSRIAAGKSIFEEALKQVNEKNKRLEADIALLKRARGKRTLALFMTAVVIALLCIFYKFLS